MKVVAVTMRDVEVFGRDKFYVQVGEDEFRVFEATVDGVVREVSTHPLTGVLATAAVEKWRDAYRIEVPIPISRPEDLVALLGRFEPTSVSSCRIRE